MKTGRVSTSTTRSVLFRAAGRPALIALRPTLIFHRTYRTMTSTEFRAARKAYDRDSELPTQQRRFRATVAYDGTDFVGWQTQPSGLGVQDVLEERLSRLFGGRVYVAGSGRTDKGVHARGQVFHFEVPAVEPLVSDGKSTAPRMVPHLAAAFEQSDEVLAMTLARTLAGASSNGLPPSVQVTDVATVPEGFHARDSCTGKRYVYTVQEGVGDPMHARYRWVLGAGKRLDVDRMSEAAAVLTGVHDFSTFGVIGPRDPRSPLKRMRRLEVRRHALCDAISAAARRQSDGTVGDAAQSPGGDVVTICAECDRFLYNMMRMISGTLVQVGLGKLSVDDVRDLLAARGRRPSSHANERPANVFKAPAHGLCLEHCFFDYVDGAWRPLVGEWPAAADSEHGVEAPGQTPLAQLS